MAGTAFLLAAVFAFSADAQTPNRRKQPRRTPTPAPVVSEPVVVSRADEYPTVVIEPVPEPSPSDVVSTDNGNSQSIEELRERLYQLENSNNSRKRDPDEKQKRIALNLDILTKSEQRADGLRKQLFEMIEKESTLRGHIDQIDNEMRPDALDRAFATVGSLRPEELKATKRRSLELEKRNKEALLIEVQRNRTNVEQSLLRADALVEKLRIKIEKEIDDALVSDDELAPLPNKRP